MSGEGQFLHETNKWINIFESSGSENYNKEKLLSDLYQKLQQIDDKCNYLMSMTNQNDKEQKTEDDPLIQRDELNENIDLNVNDLSNNEEILPDEDEDEETYEHLNNMQEEVRDPLVTYITKRGRQFRPPERYIHLHLLENNKNIEEYSMSYAKIIAMVIQYHNEKQLNQKKHVTFPKVYSLKKGLRMFRGNGKRAVNKEIQQLLDQNVFSPVNPYEMTPNERKKSMESLIFLIQQHDGTIKARACANRIISLRTKHQVLPQQLRVSFLQEPQKQNRIVT